MKPLRVLEIISGFAVEGPLGGIERFGIELSQSLDKKKVEPILCGMWAYHTAYEYTWIEKLQQQHQINAFIVADWNESAPYQSFWHVYQKLPQFVKNVDIIHSHCQFGDLLALLMKKPLGAQALVRTVHNEREWGKRPLRQLLLTNFWYPLQFDLELGVAQKVVDNLNQRRLAKIRHKLAVRSYNALNLERFSTISIDITAKKRELGLKSTARIVGTVGRLSNQKGYRYLLEAAAKIIPKFPDVYFVIIGDGHLRDELHAQANQLHLDSRVIFTGPRPDVEELLLTMNVFVNSSLWEGLPTVIMESMAARIPIIATAVGGNRELIQNEVTGWLAPPANPEKLSQIIESVLLAAPNTVQKITDQAYKKVTERFSITAVARQHEDLYHQLISNKPDSLPTLE